MMRDSSSVRLTWSLSRGPGTGGLGCFPRGFLFFGLTLGDFFLVLGLFLSVTFSSPSLDLSFGLGDGRQTFFAPSQLGGNVQPIGQLTVVGLFGLAQQIGHLGLKLGFKLIRVFPAQGTMLGGVGFDLGAVEAHLAEF